LTTDGQARLIGDAHPTGYAVRGGARWLSVSRFGTAQPVACALLLTY